MISSPARAVDSRPNLVMGVAQNYTFSHLAPFLVSLRQTGYAGEIVLFHQGLPAITQAEVRRMGVTLVRFHNLRGLFPRGRGRALLDRLSRAFYRTRGPLFEARWTWLLGAAKQRYLLYHRFLARRGSAYGRVLLCDTRDVFFQEDPFRSAPAEDLVFFEESHPLGHGALNPLWLTLQLGAETLERLRNRTTLCSGTILGTPPALGCYLQRLIDLMKTGKGLESLTGDQAFHNATVYEGLRDIPHSIACSANGSHVFTASRYLDAKTILQSANGGVINSTGAVIPIVHQYDRHAAIQKALLEKIAAWRENPTPRNQPSPPVATQMRQTRWKML